MTESALLNTARVVMHDGNLRDRVRVALTADGYHVADLGHVLTWLLSSSALVDLVQATVDDPDVQAVLAETQSLADIVTVTTDRPGLATVYRVDSTAIPDALIIAGIRVAYQERARYGLPITRADEGSE